MTQSTSNTKRPRSETTADDSRAECPFTVRVLDPREKELKAKSKKRRKRGHNSSGAGNHPDDDDGNRKILQQCAPFEPKGEFVTHSNMDVHYVVEPAKQWADMTRYNSFVLNGVKYYCEGFIYVANDASLERQKSGASTGASSAAAGAAGAAGAGTAGAQGGGGPRKRSEDDWVARILEIRASDEHHVYARVFWMYWPDELPPGTHYGKRVVQGRQPYHGASELIASNHMDVINVVSVTSMASVNHLNEDKDDDVQSALYWRQALDIRTMELSSTENVCDCNQPANPDKMLVGCGDDKCAKWIHEECLKHYALMRVYERLGHDKPHIKAKPSLSDLAVGGAVKSETGTGDVKEPLSPRESGGAASAQHSIDVKADTVEVQGASDDDAESGRAGAKNGPRTNGHAEGGKGVAVRSKGKDSAAGTPQLKREVTPSESEAGAGKGATGLATPTPVTGSSVSKSRKSTSGTTAAVETSTPSGKATAGSRFPTLQSFGNKKKPYDKLFEAELLLTPLDSSAPTMIEIRDLRRKVEGGEKVWMEPAECPVCGSAIR
ncbi:hypothetical protein SCUCBS95973_005857 [Sporothrix curviconia]|uniref:BAH domain-containing protein n=1 Tax=Sporothrix curviconia TaxID=1260050 RepID=A0ABP0C0P1_9PEZI